MGKVYYVANGRQTGFFDSWGECKAQVDGFKGAIFKGFDNREAAEEYAATFVKSDDASSSSVNKSVSSAPSYTDDEKKACEYANFLKSNNFISPVMYESLCEQISINMGKPMLFADANEKTQHFDQKDPNAPDPVKVFVDGSYNANTNEYGCGIYIDTGNSKQILTGKGLCRDGGRNVEGEVAASIMALDYLKDKHCKSVIMYHDYQGIGSWADHQWSANKGYTQEYSAFVDLCRAQGMNIKFEHVDGHTGVEGNEYVDKLAKMACGVPLSAADRAVADKIKDIPGFPGRSSTYDSEQIKSHEANNMSIDY